MAPLRVGVVIGRFQVPHLHQGHIALLAEVRALADLVVVLLGVSRLDGRTPENPLTFTQRASLFDRCIVLPLFDEPTNEAWTAQLDALLGLMYPDAAITLYGGRKSFAEAYAGRYPVETLTFQPAVTDEGTQQRAAIVESSAHEFLRGYVYALQQQYPHAHPTVDVALVRRPEVLLIRRADTGEWAFPGGFVDPTKDHSLEAAASRELYEETGLTADRGARLDYVTSLRVDDWRYRGSRDQIVSALFLGWYTFGVPRLNPLEAQDYTWVKVTEGHDLISDTHKPLWLALSERLRP